MSYNTSEKIKISPRTEKRGVRQTSRSSKIYKEFAVLVVQDYEKVKRSKKKIILNVTFRQGKISKRFKDSERSGDMLKCSKGLELSAQELLHDNQYTFGTKNILQTSIV